MKKIILPFALISFPFVSLLTTISCSSSNEQYCVMNFAIDIEKLKKIDASTFNLEPQTPDKLEKITKQTKKDFDRYIMNAFGYFFKNNNWVQDANKKNYFEQIKIENNTLTIKLNSQSPYYLPNKSFEMTLKF